MASSTNGGAKVVREVIARCLAAKSDLFAHGKITPATSDDEFIRRFNTLVHADAQAWAADVPKNLEDAIRADKKAKPEAELVLFGHWLLLEGCPGLQKTSGKKPDYHEIMKCVAACLFGPRSRERRAPNKDRLVRAASTNVVNRSSHPKPNSRTKDITKHDLRDWWTKMFDESRQASDFDAKLRSMRRLLRAYL
ncbi:hypothetical protein [Roseovarius ramblicola]|uniref:Uncharacterized protein n=1 Tax=Roseovarius ramblicola TaxID=2022336 RepID=A0ABV5I133_9RHOB